MSARCPLDFDRVRDIVLELASMPYFPAMGEDAARLAIVKLAAQIADSERQVKVAVRQLMRLYDQWPGPRLFRRALIEACGLEPCLRPLPSSPLPEWFLEWAGNQNAPLALPAASDTLAIEASPDSVHALAPSKALMRRRAAAPVHVMPKPKPTPAPLTDAEIQQREAIRVEVERLLTERKKGSA